MYARCLEYRDDVAFPQFPNFSAKAVSMNIRITGFTVVGVFLINSMTANIVSATPPQATTRNNNCNACHERVLMNRLRVTEEDFLMDIGVRPLRTYLTAPGEVVTLSATILTGSDLFAVQLKYLDDGAVAKDPNHLLLWSEANDPNNPWTRHEGPNQPYFTKDDGKGGGIPNSETPVTYHFDLRLDPYTPLDVYEVVFAVAGRSNILGKWYQEEHFYIQVDCPFELAGDLNRDCQVDSADFALMAENWLVNCIHDPNNPACIR